MAGPLGSTPGIIVGVGVGAAASAALQPAIELPRQKAWADNPHRIFDPGTLARLVAQGGIDLSAAVAEARRDGYAADKVAGLVYLAQSVPPVAEALNLWRKGLISDGLWSHVLVKNGLDARYLPGLSALKVAERLDPAVIATAIQRGIMRDPGFLPVGPPSAEGVVKRFPVSPLDAVEEAGGSGVDALRLFVETALVGLPASPDLAARMTFRKIIERVDFDRAISEGNTRNEWAPVLFEGFREILTANQYTELELRGWYDRATRLANTEKHGMSTADSDLLFKVLGRPIPEHQVVTGEARGGTYNGSIAGIPEPFLKSLRESNIRPEWYSLAYANRYTYPSAFVLRSLTQAGDLTQAESHQILLDIGWRPDLALKVSTRWAGGTGTTTGPLVKKAQGQLWTQTHKSYVAHEIGASTALSSLTALGTNAAEQSAVLALWDQEKALIRAQLTPVQIRKALNGKLPNPATGQPWTQADAMAALADRGYDAADAQTFLAE